MNTIVAAIRDRMKVREKEKEQLFDTIRTVFSVSAKEHVQQMSHAEQIVLEGLSQRLPLSLTPYCLKAALVR